MAATASSPPSTTADETAKTLPLTDIPVNPAWTPYFDEWMAHPSRDEFWQERSIEERHDQVRVPALNIAGWYDIFLDGSLRNFTGVRESGATEAAREGSRLLLGPWTHTTPPLSGVGRGRFRRAGRAELDAAEHGRRRRDAALLRSLAEGDRRRLSDEPPVRALRHGRGRLALARTSGRWRGRSRPTSSSAAAATPTRSRATARSPANAPGGDRPDIFLYDPFHPVPTVGGQLCCYPATLPPGAFDQRPVEARSDVLVYTTPPLEEDTEVTGPVRLHLWAATTAPDTDFTGKLVDIYPDGYARNLTDGIIRARYRQGTDAPRPITPGERLRVHDRPLVDQQPLPQGTPHRAWRSAAATSRASTATSTPATSLARTRRCCRAVQTIFHDAEHPSRLVLPIVPR